MFNVKLITNLGHESSILRILETVCPNVSYIFQKHKHLFSGGDFNTEYNS